MVSEPFVSSAESVMTNESDDEVFVLKFAPRLGFQLSNLKDIIDEHFNLPHVQVRCGKNGGVVLAGLFDGIPDDVESQDHESFDEINKLIGWIEGCVELPICPDSAAPKDFEVTLVNSDHISSKEVPNSIVHEVLDEIPKNDVMNDDDLLTDKRLKIDDAIIIDEEPVQFEAKFESILMKGPSDLNAHLLFDELPKSASINERELTEREGIEQVQSIVVGEFPHRVAYQVFDEMLEPQQESKQVDLKAFEVRDLRDASLLLLIRSESAELIKSLNAFPTQEEIPICYIGILCYDPGGGSWYLGCESFKSKFKHYDLRCTDEDGYGMKNLYGATWLGIGVNQHELLTSEFNQAKVNSVPQNCILGSHQVVIEYYVETSVFDPGGEQLLLTSMAQKCVNELIRKCCFRQRMGLKGQDDCVELLIFDPGDEEFMLVEFSDLDLSKYEKLSKILLYQLGKIIIEIEDDFFKLIIWLISVDAGVIKMPFDPGGDGFMLQDGNNGESLTSYKGFNHLVFDRGIIFNKEWRSMIEITLIFSGTADRKFHPEFADVKECFNEKFQLKIFKEEKENWPYSINIIALLSKGLGSYMVNMPNLFSKCVDLVLLALRENTCFCRHGCIGYYGDRGKIIVKDEVSDASQFLTQIMLDDSYIDPGVSALYYISQAFDMGLGEENLGVLITTSSLDYYAACLTIFHCGYPLNSPPRNLEGHCIHEHHMFCSKGITTGASTPFSWYVYVFVLKHKCDLWNGNFCEVFRFYDGRYNDDLAHIGVNGDSLICTGTAVFEKYIDGCGLQGEVSFRNGKLSCVMLIFPVASYADTSNMVDGTCTVFVFDPGRECSRFN